MNSRAVGILSCVALLASSVISSRAVDKKDYHHQYDEERIVYYTFDEFDITSDNVIARRIYEDDYCLDDYFFTNLAGEIMSVAPEVYYADIEDELMLIEETPNVCIDDAEYIIKIVPLEKMENETNKPERIMSFVDYNYLSDKGRYAYVLDSGNYTYDQIKSELSYFEKCLYSYDYEDDEYGHEAGLNELNFVDFFILYELAYSGYYAEEDFVIYKDEHNKYRILTSDFYNSSTYQDDYEVDYHNLVSTMWFSMLSKSQAFTNYVLEEYSYLRKHELSDDNLIKMVEECANLLLRTEGIDQKQVLLEEEKLIAYLDARLIWLDDNIESLRKFSASSAIKEYQSKPY